MPNSKNYDLDIDTSLGGNNASDYIIPSQKAIKDYVDNHSGGGTVDQTYDPTSQNAQSGVAINGAGFQKTNTAVTHTASTAVGDTITPVYIDSTGAATALSYSIAKSVPSNAVFTDTTYTIATGSANGTISVSVNGGAASDVSVKGLGSAAYTASTDYYSSSNPSGYITSSALSSYELKEKDITTLSTSGTLSLADNTIYKVSAAGTITFSLPSITNTAKFHQILVQLYMSTARTINLSTTYYFNGETPDMSDAGYYNIFYEYDSIRSGWVVGVIKKAQAS